MDEKEAPVVNPQVLPPVVPDKPPVVNPLVDNPPVPHKDFWEYLRALFRWLLQSK